MLLMESVKNPRTGKPLVKKIIRTRKRPDEHPHLPPDLIVCWQDNAPADAADIPGLGRIGPLPFFRTGGHVAHGTEINNFLVATGPACDAINDMTSQSTAALPLEHLPAALLSMLR